MNKTATPTRAASTDAIAANAQRLLWAGFLAILASGIGFGIRGGILATWAADFGFTGAQLGAIGGAGFTGFCFAEVPQSTDPVRVMKYYRSLWLAYQNLL